MFLNGFKPSLGYGNELPDTKEEYSSDEQAFLFKTLKPDNEKINESELKSKTKKEDNQSLTNKNKHREIPKNQVLTHKYHAQIDILPKPWNDPIVILSILYDGKVWNQL